MAETGGAYRFAAIGAISSLWLGAGKSFGLRLGWGWGEFLGQISGGNFPNSSSSYKSALRMIVGHDHNTQPNICVSPFTGNSVPEKPSEFRRRRHKASCPGASRLWWPGPLRSVVVGVIVAAVLLSTDNIS